MDVADSSNRNVYSMFKHFFFTEDYNQNIGFVWTKFKSSNFKLSIETGHIHLVKMKCVLNVTLGKLEMRFIICSCKNKEIQLLRNKYTPNYYTHDSNCNQMSGC